MFLQGGCQYEPLQVRIATISNFSAFEIYDHTIANTVDNFEEHVFGY